MRDMKTDAGISDRYYRPLRRQLSDEKSAYIKRFLDGDAYRGFLEYLQDGKSAYKYVAVNWFQAICWTGISARTWPHVYIRSAQPCYLYVRISAGSPKCLSLIHFNDDQIQGVKCLLDFLSLLDERGFDRVFHECRQLYARGSKALWPEAEFNIGFRLALEIFNHQYNQWEEINASRPRAPYKVFRRFPIILPSPWPCLRSRV